MRERSDSMRPKTQRLVVITEHAGYSMLHSFPETLSAAVLLWRIGCGKTLYNIMDIASGGKFTKFKILGIVRING
jgi:hypothetical protein